MFIPQYIQEHTWLYWPLIWIIAWIIALRVYPRDVHLISRLDRLLFIFRWFLFIFFLALPMLLAIFDIYAESILQALFL
jgi:hypothetical protein